MVSASSVSSSHKKKYFSKTSFLYSNPNELCDGLKLLLQEQQAGINCVIIIEENVVIADRLLEYKCVSTKQHSFLLLKCLN